MKQDQDVQIEQAGQCSFTERYSRQVYPNDQCTPCPYDINNMNTSRIFSLGTQDSSCSTCADIYSQRFNGYLEQILYEQYCKDYVKPKPPPPKPKPIVVEEPKVNESAKTNETDKNEGTTSTTEQPEKFLRTEAKKPVGTIQPTESDGAPVGLIAGIGGSVLAICGISALVMKLRNGSKEPRSKRYETPVKDTEDKIPDTANSKSALFKQKMTKEELLQKEQEEIQQIKDMLKEQGMEADEIERHVAELKGRQETGGNAISTAMKSSVNNAPQQ